MRTKETREKRQWKIRKNELYILRGKRKNKDSKERKGLYGNDRQKRKTEHVYLCSMIYMPGSTYNQFHNSTSETTFPTTIRATRVSNPHVVSDVTVHLRARGTGDKSTKDRVATFLTQWQSRSPETLPLTNWVFPHPHWLSTGCV